MPRPGRSGARGGSAHSSPLRRTHRQPAQGGADPPVHRESAGSRSAIRSAASRADRTQAGRQVARRDRHLDPGRGASGEEQRRAGTQPARPAQEAVGSNREVSARSRCARSLKEQQLPLDRWRSDRGAHSRVQLRRVPTDEVVMRLPLSAAAICCALASTPGMPDATRPRTQVPVRPEEPSRSNRVEPDVERPLAWLIASQNDDGSWGEEVHSQAPDVATTSLAGIALLRTGHTGSRGQFQSNTRRAVEYVIAAVERAPADQVAVQGPGTLPQRKLGRNIDTFLAAQFLSEALPTLPPDP